MMYDDFSYGNIMKIEDTYLYTKIILHVLKTIWVLILLDLIKDVVQLLLVHANFISFDLNLLANVFELLLNFKTIVLLKTL